MGPVLAIHPIVRGRVSAEQFRFLPADTVRVGTLVRDTVAVSVLGV